MATNSRLVVVLGATGAQGTPIVEYLLKQSSTIFRVRAVTRDVTSAKAQALARLGAELAVANFDDEVALRAALQGANAIFSLTDFYDKSTIDSELYRGLLIARIASELPDLDNFIYSSLPDARNVDNGKYQLVLPYNAKTYIKEGMQRGYPGLWKKTTVLYISFYYQNWLKYAALFGPVKQSDGTFTLSAPHASSDAVSITSAVDTGAVVDAILRGGSKYHNRTVSLVTERLTESDRLETWARALGVEAVFEHVPPFKFRARLETAGTPPALAQGLTELCQIVGGAEEYVEVDGVIRGRDIIDGSYKLKTWVEYVKEEDWSSFI